MTFADICNLVLARNRQRGVNYGAAPTNSATDFNPPYEVALAVNTAYNDFLARVNAFPIATIECFVTTTAKARSIPLNPLPPLLISAAPVFGVPMFGGGAVFGAVASKVTNPSVLRVYEFAYWQLTPSGSDPTNVIASSPVERYVESVSTAAFRSYTGAYAQRLGAYAAFPDIVTQQFGLRRIDMYPGTATAGDAIKLLCCPDPQSTGTACAAAQGGVLVAPGDQPLFPPEFHMALVFYACGILAEKADKIAQGERDMQRYEQIIANALDFGASTMEGGAEQQVIDTRFALDVGA